MHKIMLVEDDPVIRQMIKKMLEQWGYQVFAVEDFMEVLSLFVKEEPQLVLMDIGLPLFNGYHWCQEIRKNGSNHVFIFTRSGYGYRHGYQYGW